MKSKLFERIMERAGTPANAARLVGVSRQRWNVWRRKGLSDDGALRCWLALHPQGKALLEQWKSQEVLRKAEKSLRDARQRVQAMAL